MAELVTVHLNRTDSSVPWGFRLHGGRDFGIPLSIVRVAPDSVAAGKLYPGDIVIQIAGYNTSDLDHMDVNDLVRSVGNQITLKTKRGKVISTSSTLFLMTPPISPIMNINGPNFGPPPPPPPPPAGSGIPPPPPPPPPSGGMLASPAWRQQPQQESSGYSRPSTHPSMMGPRDGPQPFAYVPEGLLKTMATADKKPFTYTPAGLTAKDLQSPAHLRRDKLQQQPGSYPHILPNPPRAPTNRPQTQSPQQSQDGTLVYNPYNSPIDMYSNHNVADAMRYQTGQEYPADMAGLVLFHLFGSQSRQFDPSQSDVHHALQEGAPRGQHSTVYDEPRNNEDYYPSYKGYVNPTIQSRSFKMLQRMTGADDNYEQEPPIQRQPSYEEDDMRFTSLNKGRIPSRSFQMLQRMTGADKDDEIIRSVQNEPEYNESAQYFNPAVADYAPAAHEMTEEEAEQMRYRGGSIPSRSFRMLQEMTGEAPGCEGKPNVPPPIAHQTPPTLRTNAMQGHSYNDPPIQRPRSPLYVQQSYPASQPQYGRQLSPPYTGPGVRPSEMQAEPEPKKYTGAYIPGKAFQMLQAMTGDDNPQVVPSVFQANREGNQPPQNYEYQNSGVTDF